MYEQFCPSLHHLHLLGSDQAVLSELTPFVFTWIRRSCLVRAYTICIYLDQKEQSCQSLHHLYLLGSEGAVLTELTPFAFTWIRMSSLVRDYTICIYLDQKSRLVRAYTILEGSGSVVECLTPD